MTTQRQRVHDLISQTYELQRQRMTDIIDQLIPEDSLQPQNGEMARMEARFTDLENQIKSLTTELNHQKKKDNWIALKKLHMEKKADTQKMQMEIAALRKQVEEQREMQLAGQKMEATIVQLQAEVQAQRQLNLDLVQEVRKMQTCNASLQQELEVQKKTQVDIKQLQNDLEAIKKTQPDIEKLQKQITEQIIKEIKQETKVPSPPHSARPPSSPSSPSSRRVYTTEYLEALQRIQAAEKEVQDLKQEVKCLKLEKMTEKQIYDENIQAAEERNQRYRDDVLKRLENVEHSAMELEVHTAQNTKERQDLAAKLDSRTFDAFAAQICQTIKQQIDEGLKGQEAKWTSVMDKAKEEEEKKLKKMEDYITAMENGWKKTIKKLMEPPPKEEVDEDAACTTHCLSCSRNVKTTTKSTLPALPAFPALPNPPSRGVTRNHRAP